MNTNEVFKDYKVGILDLITEILVKEGIKVSYSTTVNQFLSSSYGLYRHYEKPILPMNKEALEDYIRRNYLDNFIVIKNGEIIMKSKEAEEYEKKILEGEIYDEENNTDEIEFAASSLPDILSDPEKDIIDKMAKDRLDYLYDYVDNNDGKYKDTYEKIAKEIGEIANNLQCFSEEEDIINEYKITIDVANEWNNIIAGDTYKELSIFDFLFNGDEIEYIKLVVQKTPPYQFDGYDYEHDISVMVIMSVQDAEKYLNTGSGNGPFYATAYYNKKAFDKVLKYEDNMTPFLEKMLTELFSKYGGKE